ncbi:MAG: methionyl-tRNA formyltransferase [Dehalococcoidia bacterium]|nr:methionyl-tRNA formyltransferase [Dehalococcoidia bacterium]
MRIALIGQAAFGEKTLEALLDMGEEVVGVYTTPDIPDRENTFKQLALQLGVPVFQPEKMRAPGVYENYVKSKPDLNVMAFVTDIVPESILNHPGLGTIQYHPSLLPRHRGGSAINWAVINGEARTGLTIFWPDKGIDTGPILLQKEVDIAPDDTTGSLYFNKLFPLGIEAIKESIELIRQGKAPRIPQDEAQATYEGLCTKAAIDWHRPADEVYNLIRGTNPQPGATTAYGDIKLKIFDSELRPGNLKGVPGEVTEVTESGFLVTAPGGAIFIKRVQPEGSSKIAAADFIAHSGLKPGDHLGE